MGTLRTPFPYPGGKSRLADWIIGLFPEHRRYVEVFGGSGAVLFQKDPATEEVLNDLNTDITHFFETVRDRPGDLADWLADKDFARHRFEDWAEAYYAGERSEDAIERAGRFYFLRYAQFSATIANKGGFRAGVGPARTWRNARSRERLEELAARFAAVEVRASDWRSVLGEFDGEDALFYLDPPYLGRENYYRNTEFAHSALADALADLDGRWLVSYDDLPSAFDREDWFVLSTDAYHKLGNGTGGGGETVERLVMNFDPKTGETADQSEIGEFAAGD